MISTVNVPEAVMERVNAEIVKAILETPDYIQKIVTQLLTEPQRSGGYSDPDNGKPFFEVMLRRELRNIIHTSVAKLLRERYSEEIENCLKEAINKEEKVEGSLAYAFAKVIKEDWKLEVNPVFKFNKDD